MLEGDDESRDVLVDFRSTLTQYVTAYAFFAQIIDYGNPRYLKFSVYADLLARQLRAFTTEVTDPGEVDVSDIVLTHYKLEKIRTEDLELSTGEAMGLDGLTEAGMATVRERERSAKSEIVEKVNKYLGDLDVDDRYKVDKIESLLAEVAADDNLRAIAGANSRADFAHAPGLQMVTEDAVWQVEDASNAVLKELQGMPWERLRAMLLECGLYERLREAEAM